MEKRPRRREKPTYSNLGSSPRSVGFWPERSPYLQEEVFLIPVPICNSLYDFDLVIDPFKDAGVDGITAVCEDARIELSRLYPTLEG